MIAVPARERKLKRGSMAKQMTAALAVEDDLLARARRGEETALQAIVQQNNRRLFRLARSIVRDEHEAEDVVQECYVRAFTHLSEFRGDSSLATWLTRITLNEAYGRLRRRRAAVNVENIENEAGATEAQIIPFPLWSSQPDPERSMAQQQINKILERAIDALPEPFRLVLVARLIEDMSIEETAELLGLRPQTVKTRLHRARAMLRGDLERQVGPLLTGVFPFDGVRCQRMADAVIARLRALGATTARD